MLTETGRVVALDSSSVWVETIRQSTCGACSANKGCGHGILNRLGDGRRHTVRVMLGDHEADDFRVDDAVNIAVHEQLIVRSSFVVYLMPLLCMLLAAALLPQFIAGEPDAIALIGAVLGFGAGVGLVRLHGLRHQFDTRYQPLLLGRAEHQSLRATPLELS